MYRVVCFLIAIFSINAFGSIFKFENENKYSNIQEVLDPLSADDIEKIQIGSPLSTLAIEVVSGKITINGRGYINGHAAIKNICDHSDSGKITFTATSIKKGKPIDELFLHVPFSSERPKSIAIINEVDGNYIFTHKNGEQRSAENYALYSQGVILRHEGGYFSYLDENGMTSIHEIPKDFVFSNVQAADISKAGFVAFMRDFAPIKMGFLEVANVREYEFIFIDIRTGVVRTSEKIRIDTESKDRFNESIKQRLAIEMTNKGLIVTNLSSDFKNLYVRNLHQGIKKSIDYRKNGIAFFWIQKSADGVVSLTYTYGAKEKRKVDDLNKTLLNAK